MNSLLKEFELLKKMLINGERSIMKFNIAAQNNQSLKVSLDNLKQEIKSYNKI